MAELARSKTKNLKCSAHSNLKVQLKQWVTKRWCTIRMPKLKISAKKTMGLKGIVLTNINKTLLSNKNKTEQAWKNEIIAFHVRCLSPVFAKYTFNLQARKQCSEHVMVHISSPVSLLAMMEPGVPQRIESHESSKC